MELQFNLLETLYNSVTGYTAASNRAPTTTSKTHVLVAGQDPSLVRRLLSKSPVFYMIEPFQGADIVDDTDAAFIDKIPTYKTLSMLFNCNFSRLASSALRVCYSSPTIDCKNMSVRAAEEMCKRYNVVAIESTVVKDISVLDHVSDYRLNLKVVYVVRDPRSIIISRMGFSDGKLHVNEFSANIARTQAECVETGKSLEYIATTSTRTHPKCKLLRYEDVIYDPATHAIALGQFMDLPVTDAITSSVIDLTFPLEYDWVFILSKSMARVVQRACKTVFDTRTYESV